MQPGHVRGARCGRCFEMRLERAAHLLRDSTLAGKEIAWACGFSSPSYFIRAFRAHYGQTPKSWRAARP